MRRQAGVDIAVTRTADQAGASGAGLLAALLFDAVGPGGSLDSGQRRGQHTRGRTGQPAVQPGDGDGSLKARRT